MSGMKTIFLAALFSCACAFGVTAAQAACSQQEYLAKMQRVQARIMELQSKDPAKLQSSMEKMQEIGEDMKEIDQSNALAPETLDHMCQKMDELYAAME